MTLDKVGPQKMTALEIVKGIGGLLWFGAGIIVALFGNFLLRKHFSDSILDIPIPSNWVHAVLGPILLIVNSTLLVFLCALYLTPVDDATLAQIQSTQIKWVFGPLCNPFYLGQYRLFNGCGYAFLIILWWLGMHTFLYSIRLNTCWKKFGFPAYRLKWMFGFIGIPIGAFLPPLLLKLGLPRIFP